MDRKLLGTLAGSCALGIGIGLQRSQFAVLGEIMADERWFANSEIGVLSGLSLAGYIVGCVHQTSIKNELNNIRTVRIGLALGVLSFFIEPLINTLSWQVIWRLIAGWASAQLVTGIPGLGIRFHALDNKRRALAYIFAGAGFAALLASVLVSLLASSSIIESWVVTGLIAVVLAIPIHNLLDICIEEELLKRFEPQRDANPASAQVMPIADTSGTWTRGLRLLAGSTLFFGAAQVTVLTYFPLLLVTRFNVSEAAAASSFANVGLGYTIGALASGYMPKKWGTDLLMTVSASIGIVGTLACAAGSNIPAVGLGGFAFAFWNGSMMGLLLHRINQSVPAAQARTAWSQFSLVLSIGFLAFTFISAPIANQNVTLIIWIGVVLAGLHLVLQLLARRDFQMRLSQHAAS
ncbi:MAG: YbfB/YjiJ family MFS transporter [Cyanobacteria bacterium M_surface_7_m2_037]|nr:YbfB/YjiJ family MFS transporter [Cyanobacteria bacterium K_DeepCast_0m_m1_088]MBM5794868.1 YbfB/YjiJ family MFS transporter [Cyanobacteria bacterium M_surface_7_m2_037]